MEQMHLTMTQEIVSYIHSEPILNQAAHAKRLEDNPEWAVILGLGYNDKQRRNLIYQHLTKLKSSLLNITGGDATKAKQLTDLMHTHVHAGEGRQLSFEQKDEQHRHDLNEGAPRLTDLPFRESSELAARLRRRCRRVYLLVRARAARCRWRWALS